VTEKTGDRKPKLNQQIDENNCENNQDATLWLIYYSKSVLHVSGDVFAHHKEHLFVFTVCANVHPSCCQLVSWMN